MHVVFVKKNPRILILGLRGFTFGFVFFCFWAPLIFCSSPGRCFSGACARCLGGALSPQGGFSCFSAIRAAAKAPQVT